MAPTSHSAAFQLKGSLFTLTVIELLNQDLTLIDQQLQALCKQTPRFFHFAPVIIDVQKLGPEIAGSNRIDYVNLNKLLRSHKLVPVGVRGATAQSQQAITDAGLAVMTQTRPETEQASNQAAAPAVPASTVNHKAAPTNNAPQQASKAAQATDTKQTKVITQPVRTGQQIYSAGDLIILNAVSPGAEIIAEGHIHIYGSMRGRALAGVKGNATARIFCQHLDAELIAIAGHYWVNEQKASNLKDNVHIYLENERLVMKNLSAKQ